MSWSPLPPEYVTELADNPAGFEHGPLEVGRFLPGERVALTMRLSGKLLKFTVRVTHDEDGQPQIVDLRMRAPAGRADVAITSADLKSISVAALAAEALHPSIPGPEVTHDNEPIESVERVERPRGRPTKLTDHFLREVTRLARAGWQEGCPPVDNYTAPLNAYIAAGMKRADMVDFMANEQTVRGWRKAAAARRRKSPEDTSFLQSGELRGKPGKGSLR